MDRGKKALGIILLFSIANSIRAGNIIGIAKRHLDVAV